MSSDLAIAGVTATLRHLLKRGVVDHVKLGDQGPVSVTAKAPDLIDTESADLADQINLYMYHVAPNPGWRNVGLPSRDSSGARISNPPLALDLYYVVTAYSQRELYADVLLGYAMQFLHEVPVLTQRAIRHALQPAPTEVSFIRPEDLLTQFEQIKIAPHALDADEMYKLWMAFQTTYRPSAAYHVSVVLIEDPQPASSPLPVLMIGEPDPQGRPGGVKSNPGLAPSTPMLTSLAPPAKNGPVIRLGETLTINGFHLADGPASVLLTNLLAPQQVPLTINSAPGASPLTVLMPAPAASPAGLRAGACDDSGGRRNRRASAGHERAPARSRAVDHVDDRVRADRQQGSDADMRAAGVSGTAGHRAHRRRRGLSRDMDGDVDGHADFHLRRHAVHAAWPWCSDRLDTVASRRRRQRAGRPVDEPAEFRPHAEGAVMNAPTRPSDWLGMNQQMLAQALTALRARLEGDVSAQPDPLAVPTLARIAEAFGLSRFEAQILLLCASRELDASAWTNDTARHPTFGFALSLFDARALVGADSVWTAAALVSR